MPKVVYCLLAVTLGFITSLASAPAQEQVQMPGDIISVPIELAGGQPAVQVWFAGQAESFNMLLDTGSNRTVFFVGAAERLPQSHAEPELAELGTFLAVRSLPVGQPIGVRVEEGSAHSRLIEPLYYLSDAEMPEFDRYVRDYDGILGMDAFAGAFIGLEWNASPTLHAAYMIDPEVPHFPVLPPVPVKINGQEIACLADTGVGATPGLIVRAHAPRASAILSREAFLSRPSTLAPPVRVRRIMANVELSGVDHAMIVDIEERDALQGQGRGPECILGQSAMLALQTTLDFVRSVGSARYVREPELSYNRAGISEVRWSQETGEVIISGIDPDSAAEDARLLAGDEILAVNGISLSQSGLTALRDALYAPAGTEMTMTIRRAGEASDVRLVSREVLN